MTCSYCRAWNADDEHRCQRCGRRLAPVLNNTLSEAGPFVTGALATAPRPVRAMMEPALPPAPSTHAPELPAQPNLCAPPRAISKVIPFESIASGRVDPPGGRPSPPRTAPRRPAGPKPDDTQGTLDFLPPAPPATRKLKTTVEAVIYCDSPVATKMHRAVAAAMDLSMILIAFGLFLLTFHFSGGEFTLTRESIAVFGAAFLLIGLFYGALWLVAQCDSPGKRWLHLKLINFDGFPPDANQRLTRFAGACLSLAALGLGVAWAGVDEESLAWHDHISKTFLTLKETNSNFYRQR